jgi:Na+-transporting methylmalonyl-CoA/oxaloacetate decarboxylase gamma subunit
MGEWSDYFEDLPEENQANYVGEKFNPAGAKTQWKTQQKAALNLSKEQQQLDAKIATIVHNHKKAE